MHWSLAVDNFQSLQVLQAEAETLSRVDLHELVLHRDGPILRLRFDVPVVPASLPRRWPAKSNTSQITLAAWGAAGLQISGWEASMKGQLSVEGEREDRRIVFIGAGVSISAKFALLRVETISGYLQLADAAGE